MNLEIKKYQCSKCFYHLTIHYCFHKSQSLRRDWKLFSDPEKSLQPPHSHSYVINVLLHNVSVEVMLPEMSHSHNMYLFPTHHLFIKLFIYRQHVGIHVQASTLTVVRLSRTTELRNRTSKTKCLVVRRVKSYFQLFLSQCQ